MIKLFTDPSQDLRYVWSFWGMEDISQHGYRIGYHNALQVWGRWLFSIYQGQVACGEGVVQENVAMVCDGIKVSTHYGTWHSASAAAFLQLSRRPALRKQSLWNGPWCLTVQQNLEMNWHMNQNTYGTYDTNWLYCLMLLPPMYFFFNRWNVQHSVDLGGHAPVRASGKVRKNKLTDKFGGLSAFSNRLINYQWIALHVRQLNPNPRMLSSRSLLTMAVSTWAALKVQMAI